MTPEELEEHNPLPLYKMTGVNPVEEYKRWFDNNGFVVLNEKVDIQALDDRCLKNIPRQKLKSIVNHDDYRNILEIQFVDFTLNPR